ncbi:MAG: hypothetical protein GC166_14245 [Alphaproteobacteria bacterium]|nr:hypothetical protein [Alphaproteobacteria bacterium]
MAETEETPDLRRVRLEVRRFKNHLMTYLSVVGLLFVINVLSGGFWGGHWWFLWPAAIWGVFVALQAVNLFGDNIGRDWEDRMVDRVLARRQQTERKGPTEPPKPYSPPEPPPAS